MNHLDMTLFTARAPSEGSQKPFDFRRERCPYPRCPGCGRELVGKKQSCVYCQAVRAAEHAVPVEAAGSEPPPPDTPTKAWPGSPARMRVLRQRVKAGTALFHEEDAGYGTSLREVRSKLEQELAGEMQNGQPPRSFRPHRCHHTYEAPS